MSNIIRVNPIDPLKSGKDCMDFTPLNDGTLAGDPKYCQHSRLCRQIGMKSDYIFFISSLGEEDMDYFCTGVYLTTENKGIDEAVS